MVKKPVDSILDIGDFKTKKRKNSRAKGSNFERKIAQQLNARFDTKEFCRTPGSGAFGTTHKLPQYLKVYGDLITPENFKFVIEAKVGYEVKFEDLFAEKSMFFKFIKQAKRDGKNANKPWVLIYKRDRHTPFVTLPFRLMDGDVAVQSRNEIILNDKYYIYPLNRFLELPDGYFYT